MPVARPTIKTPTPLAAKPMPSITPVKRPPSVDPFMKYESSVLRIGITCDANSLFKAPNCI